MVLPNKLLSLYFDRMIGKLFKILPMKEGDEDTLPNYMSDLLDEMIGLETLELLSDQPYYVSIVATVSYLNGHIDACSSAKVKSRVFKAIGLCRRLRDLYGGGEADGKS